MANDVCGLNLHFFVLVVVVFWLTVEVWVSLLPVGVCWSCLLVPIRVPVFGMSTLWALHLVSVSGMGHNTATHGAMIGFVGLPF